MELIERLWKSFKVEPEIWFFFGFLLTFTLTIRKVLWFLPLRGELNEYSGAYLYLSDIFLALTVLSWVIIILYNKIDLLSILKNVPRETLLLPLILVAWSFISFIWAENKIVSIFRSVKILEFYLLYIFVIVRLFYWNNYLCEKCSTPIAKGLFHVEQSFATWQAWNNLRNTHWTLLKKIFGLIIFIGLFQAIIGIIQFILQHSIGLFWLKESLISPDIAGAAKIIFDGENFIRAYGLFPHPNILGGFLVFSIFVSWLYYKMFHVEHFDADKNVPRGTIDGASVEHPVRQMWNNLWDKRGTIFKVLLGSQLLALILTFSKSAILGLFLGLIYYAYINIPSAYRQAGVEHPTRQVWNIPRIMLRTMVNFFRKKKRLLTLIGLIIIFSVFILKPDWNSLFVKSLDERSIYLNVSPAHLAMQSIAGGRGTMEDMKMLILGIGNSQFVINMQNSTIIKESWMLQPVHNVFLLIWSELGLVGLLVSLLFVGYILKLMFHACHGAKQRSIPERMFHPEKIVPRGTINGASVEHPMGQAWNNSYMAKTFQAIFIGLLFIMFFDHYPWDIQQGSFLLWITMGFLVGAGEYNRYLTK